MSLGAMWPTIASEPIVVCGGDGIIRGHVGCGAMCESGVNICGTARASGHCPCACCQLGGGTSYGAPMTWSPPS
eukprot:12419925-Prorocentrum_lima.AAC.1